MKKLIFIILFIPLLAAAQVTDSFDDGDFTNNPSWTGDTSKFEVDALFQLHLNAPAVEDTAYLSTPSLAINNAVWGFYVKLDFNPSSANYAKVYLVSDQPNLRNSLNGYFVKIGNTEDEISLYKQTGSSEVEIIDGKDDRIDYSPVTVRIQVTRDSLGNWELFSDTLGSINYYSEGTVFDNTHTLSNYLGIFCRYTSTRSDKFYFDDFTDQLFIDTIAPDLLNLNVISSTELSLQFSEPVTQLTSEDTTNYTVNNGIGKPITALRDTTDSSSVYLIFSTQFNNGQINTLTINNVEDTAGNAIVELTEDFMYFIPDTPLYRDVVINEIFADPSPQVGLPSVEFIEIFNATPKIFDLTGWIFSDGTTDGYLGNYILTPNAFLIICPIANTADYSSFGNVLGIDPFPTLNNTGDNLLLYNNPGNIIDQVNYTDSWYQDDDKAYGGWSLEQINPFHPCSEPSNWKASENSLIGGTPGTINSIFNSTPDTTRPYLLNASVLSATQIQISFSKSMDSLSLINAEYIIDNGISIDSISPTGPYFIDVILDISPPLDSLIIYNITITNATDCAGNIININTAIFGIGVEAGLYEIVINEIFASTSNPVGLPESEFVELYNTTNKLLNLNGYFFSDASTSVIINNAIIFPDDYLILCSLSDIQNYSTYGRTIGLNDWPTLNNSDDILSITNTNGNVIFSVSYTDKWYQDDNKDDGGWTLEMIDPANPCGGINNWIASNDPKGGTPGEQNSVYGSNPDINLPELKRAAVLSDSIIQLFFNEPFDSTTVLNTSIYFVDKGIGNSETVDPVEPDYMTLILSFSQNFSENTIYTITVESELTDCAGNLLGDINSCKFAIPKSADSLDIVINEVLFNPIGDGVDFVEIYNRSNNTIDLKDLRIAKRDELTTNISSDKLISDEGYLIFPQEYIVFTTDIEKVKEQYITSNPDGFIELESMPSFNNDEGEVVIIDDSLINVIDDFSYDEDMHFQLLNDFDGVSLERINYERPTNEKANWHSAAESVGFATPGYKNSQYSNLYKAEGEISIEPEIFSPDNDGYNDVVNIHYDFKKPGYVANITIYDAKGRLVKRLVKNELLATKGIYAWDGMNEYNQKSRIGIYIIYFEVFDLDGNVEKYKKICVLASRLN